LANGGSGEPRRGEFYLERFDDDGAVQTDAWYPICKWGFNTAINAAGLDVDNLGVAYNFSAGNITATGSTALQAVSATSIRGTQLLLGPDELGIGAGAGLAAWVDGKLRATDNIETTAQIRADTVAPFAQGAVRVASDLTVEGQLTVGSVNVMTALEIREPRFTAVAPLRKVFNLQTGELELRVDELQTGGNPFFCAGLVSENGTVLARKGARPNFTVARYGTGAYEVIFEEPHPDGALYIVNVTAQTFHSWVRAGSEDPTATGFKVGVVNSSNQAADFDFYFMVLA
jgi:hypothetical protein